MGANAESGAVKLFSSKRRVVAAAAVVLLVLFLLRPGASRLKTRITNSISRAVARPADIGSVHLRFLPQPGFDLENLVIYEDAAFGAEPMLRAPEVTAVVRLTSLLRGRLDIARLELTEPSLNLVRRQDGRWNWEALLERAERTPLAPTAKSKSESRPGFPYIEASSGRINFKAGQEKKPYALLNADFALWQESENTWGVRLKAEPLRTDMSLSDTGLLRMSGTWQRAGSLRETPLQFSLEWNHAQLGQLTKLVLGTDKGWRGDLRLDATLSGMPAAMRVTADTSIQDFHRYDISSVEGIGLAAHCEGRYNSAEGMMHEIFCNAPVGNGMITLHGDAGLPGVHRVDLALDVESVPVSAVAQLARRAKKNLPADLVSAGGVQGNFVVKEEGWSPQGPEFEGHGEITDLRVQSAVTNAEFAPGNIPFSLSAGRANSEIRLKSKSIARAGAEGLPAQGELHIEYGPFPVALGRPAVAQARGWVGRSGYGMVIRGEGEVAHTLRLASLLGVPAVKANVEGLAQMELEMAGSWAGSMSGSNSGFFLPQVTGTVQLHNVRATVRGVNGPVEISSAELQLLPEEARVEKLNALVANTHWTGSLDLPRGCGTPGACLVRFNLNTEEAALSDLYKDLSSPPSRRRWYQVLSSSEAAGPTFLGNLRASGKVSAGRLRIRNVVANRVSASLELERGKLKISDLRADLLGGKHRGEWQADFTATPVVYTGSGTATGISLQQIADAMHDPWISGTADGTYQLTASGADTAAFWESAAGKFEFGVRDGVLPHLSLASDEGPLRVARWQGRASLHSGKIEIEKSKLISSAQTYEISGIASLGQVLDFKLARGADIKLAGAGAMVYSITGTLREPRVELIPTPETQARLKR
ncbi:MAG: AsmA family protein [Candidatus Sulfotelmatobacter sp.]|jgi:AsmA-like protein